MTNVQICLMERLKELLAQREQLIMQSMALPPIVIPGQMAENSQRMIAICHVLRNVAEAVGNPSAVALADQCEWLAKTFR